MARCQVSSVRRDARILSPASAHGLSSGEANRCIDGDKKAVGDELHGLRSLEPCHTSCIGGDTQLTPTPPDYIGQNGSLSFPSRGFGG